PDENVETLPVGPISGAVVGLTALATLLLGLLWAPLFDLAEKATMYFSL
ncbi:MAG: hypothetical protein QOH26_974, partial [Actinomycetota bacterium]|nr:hypothetical protein [Actinomycetota bacterium]